MVNTSRRSPEEIDKILSELKRVFAKAAKRKYWSVIDTPAWKKKERKYLEDLSRGSQKALYRYDNTRLFFALFFRGSFPV